MVKGLELVHNNAGGLDLMVTRDAGNAVRVLTGNPERSLEFFKELGNIVYDALEELENV